ncbi:MAG: hypothetical protein HKO90_10720 [Flavobacteriaceae bacterium]|nr:hypothetical protein [Flavobacteriaceae bacterium]
MKKPLFHLEKWYLDVVDDNSRSSIFYTARLRWFGVSFQYVEWIRFDGDKVENQAVNFRRVALPKRTNDVISWQDSKLDVMGEWTAMDGPIKAKIYDSPDGYLNWYCYQPRSKVKLMIGKDEMEGLGYVEKLVLTAYPWHIPINHLRWGRYVSDKHALVWIQILEKSEKQWVWLDGVEIEDTFEIDDKVILNNYTKLSMYPLETLQSGRPISKALGFLLKGVINYKSEINRNFVNAYAQKWLSKGHLEINNNTDTGHVIHEWVNFS